MRQGSWVSSLFRYSTWPGPAGLRMMRQKLALVVVGPPSVSLRRMNGFSPVRTTWCGSADMVRASLAISLRRYFTACAGGRLWQVGETLAARLGGCGATG